jgi:hypothetical protein
VSVPVRYSPRGRIVNRPRPVVDRGVDLGTKKLPLLVLYVKAGCGKLLARFLRDCGKWGIAFRWLQAWDRQGLPLEMPRDAAGELLLPQGAGLAACEAWGPPRAMQWLTGTAAVDDWHRTLNVRPPRGNLRDVGRGWTDTTPKGADGTAGPCEQPAAWRYTAPGPAPKRKGKPRLCEDGRYAGNTAGGQPIRSRGKATLEPVEGTEAAGLARGMLFAIRVTERDGSWVAVETGEGICDAWPHGTLVQLRWAQYRVRCDDE